MAEEVHSVNVRDDNPSQCVTFIDNSDKVDSVKVGVDKAVDDVAITADEQVKVNSVKVNSARSSGVRRIEKKHDKVDSTKINVTGTHEDICTITVNDMNVNRVDIPSKVGKSLSCEGRTLVNDDPTSEEEDMPEDSSDASLDALSGKDWTYTLHFVDILACEENGEPTTFQFSKLRYNNANLKCELMNLLNGDLDEIQSVAKYKTPLDFLPTTAGALHHKFILVKTEKSWITLEKNTVGIFVQRGRREESVGQYFLGKPMEQLRPTPVEKKRSADMRCTIDVLVNILHSEINVPYLIIGRNCQDFTDTVYKVLVEQQLQPMENMTIMDRLKKNTNILQDTLQKEVNNIF